MFSVTQFGKELDKSKYSWDKKNKIFSTKENDLVLDFSCYNGVTFNTGNCCTFNTDFHCTFNTGSYCIFKTGNSCTFKTGYCCTFKTSNCCTFKTSSNCTFNTGSDCTFNTGNNCTFNTNSDCTFNTGDECFIIRYDVKGATEIPANKTIKLNGHGISGYTKVKEVKDVKENNCNGKVVVIDGKEYILQLKN